MAFGLHQLLEYLLAILLVGTSVHVQHGRLLLVAGCVLAALALSVKGPIALVGFVPRRLLAVLELAVVVLLAAGPAVGALRPDATGIVVAEIAAVGWIRIMSLTRYRTQTRVVSSSRDSPRPSAHIPRQPVGSGAEQPTGPAKHEGTEHEGTKHDAIARGAGRIVGLALRAAVRRRSR